MLSTHLLKPRTCGKRGSGLGGGNPEPPTCCLSWGDPAPDLEAGLRALCFGAFLRAHLCCLGAWPFSHWAPRLCPGQGQRFIAQEDETCSFEMPVPRGSHTGKKEVGRKSWAALWHEGSFVQDASLSLTTRGRGGVVRGAGPGLRVAVGLG